MRSLGAAVALAVCAVVAAGTARAQDQGFSPQGVLAVAKLAGACGILDAMIHFQNTTRLPGGEEYVTRFWGVEAARLGYSVQQLSEQCDRAVTTYDQMWSAAGSASE